LINPSSFNDFLDSSKHVMLNCNVRYGYKGKGVTIHLLVEANGQLIVISSTNAMENEKEQERSLIY
jgi:tRNA(Ile2) C34 agmatinyltransferase TiaS